MLIFLYGPDTYGSMEKLNQLKEKFKKEIDKSGLNIIVLEGSEIIIEQLHQALSMSGFLVTKRLVILKNILKENKKEDVFDEVLNQLEKVEKNDNIIVIFWEAEIPSLKGKKAEIFAFLEKGKYTQEFSLLSLEKINQWVKKEIKKRGAVIEEGAMRKLVAYVENNLWQLSNEIDKLIAFKPKDKITIPDIELLVEAKIDDNIFHLIDAVAEKNFKRALKLVNEQLESGMPWSYLLAILIRQFRILLLIAEKLKEKDFINSKSLANELHLHPYVAQKSLVQARKYSFEELKKIYQKLLEIDLKLKSEKVGAKVLFNLFITEICQK